MGHAGHARTNQQVCRFITAVLKQLLATISGSEHNLQCISRRKFTPPVYPPSLPLTPDARRFISAKQFEPINLHSLVKDLRIGDISWLHSDCTRPNPAESDTRRRLAASFVFWLFEDYLVPLVRVSMKTPPPLTTEHVLRHRDWTDEVRDGILPPSSLARSVSTAPCKASKGAARTARLGKRRRQIPLIPAPTSRCDAKPARRLRGQTRTQTKRIPTDRQSGPLPPGPRARQHCQPTPRCAPSVDF